MSYRKFKTTVLCICTVLLLSLFSCSKKEPVYVQEFDKPEIQLRLHAYDSRRELEKVIGNERLAMAVWSPNDNICDVYFMRWDFESLGHEVTHCQHGTFHPEVLDAK